MLQHHANERHMRDFGDAEDLREFEHWCHRKGKYISGLSVLGNCAGTRYAGTGLCAFTATGIIRDVPCCPDGTGVMVHALDHIHYARWIPVQQRRDMIALPMKHPGVAREFRANNFTVPNTNNVFSSIQSTRRMNRTTH